MARIEIPLFRRILHSTGDEVLQARLKLRLRNNQNAGIPVEFVVDPGTEMTTMSAWRARTLDLPIPSRPVQRLNLHGQEIRRGWLRARIIGLDPTEYVFPCYFLGDPAVPAPIQKSLLGLTGVIDQIRLTFDGTVSLAAPRGILAVERI
ncbi:MAG: hypothetical protein ACYC61_14655 [Isosphaeraceae bacterium]